MVCELIKRGEGGTTMSQGASWYRKLPQLIRLIQLQQLEKRNLEKQRQKNVNKIIHTLSLQSHDIIIIFFLTDCGLYDLSHLTYKNTRCKVKK